jgi:predicted ArsR family transcriptional regulator
MGFPPLFGPKTGIEVQKKGGKMVATMKTLVKNLGREFLSNGGVSQTDLSLSTGLPSWKISRFFRRLELLKLIEVEEEPRFTRGRPRKVGRLTPKGVEYFTGLLGEAHDDKFHESHESSAEGARLGGGLDG